jgi:hypothetical protein
VEAKHAKSVKLIMMSGIAGSNPVLGIVAEHVAVAKD